MRRPMLPGSNLKHFRRFQQVIGVFARYGFGEVLTRIRVWNHINIEGRLFRHEHELTTLTIAERLRLALEELGPSYIKLGQLLSTRPDLVPPEIITELKKLQATVHFIPADTIKGIVQCELGRPVAELFDSFDDKPLAAASLAQVHRAVLEGRQVVLKVQRPDIVENIKLDIDIMRTVARLAERSPAVYLINPVGLVEEFEQQIRKELDFRMEANNMHRFAGNFANDDTIHIAEVFPELSTERVITMEYLDGINISETQRLIDSGCDLSLIAKRGTILSFQATFQHGFFHADPHPGNIIVLPDNVIGLVDFGMMAVLSLRDRERLAKLVYFISVHDEKRVARALNELMESEETIPAEDLEPAMSAIIKEYVDVPMKELHLAAMLFAMMRAILMHGARLRPQLIWVTKSIAIQEDIIHQLNADFNLVDLGKPYAQKVLTEKLNPIRQPRELYYWFNDILDMVKDLPYDIGIVVREIRKGRLKIEFEHLGLEPIRRTLDRFANTMSLTIIIAALLMSSSVVVLARVPPFVGNIPALGFFGYLIALVLGIMLVISIARR